jgi:hypothetical protein
MGDVGTSHKAALPQVPVSEIPTVLPISVEHSSAELYWVASG